MVTLTMDIDRFCHGGVFRVNYIFSLSTFIIFGLCAFFDCQLWGKLNMGDMLISILLFCDSSSLALTNGLPSIRQSVSPSGPVCFQKKALLIGIQYYNSTNEQLDGKDRLDTPAGEQLKGPHFDVQSMRQLLLGKAFRLYHPHSFLRSDYFLHQIVTATTQTISLCLLTTATQKICSPRKRTS